MSRILIIDDSPLISDMLRNGLVEHGFQVAQAMNANEGYTKALEYHPDLILLDVQLPDVIGFDLCRVIKNHQDLRHVPIIMVTGTAHSTEEKVKGFQMGIDDFVLKPFDLPELIERVKAVLRRTQAQRPPPVMTPPAVTPQVSAQKGSFSPAPQIQGAAPARRMSWKEFLLAWLSHPVHVKLDHAPAGVVSGFLLVLSTLIVLCMVFSPNSKTVLTLMIAGVVWGILLATLVMGGSILGVSFKWKEGSRMLAMAGMPYLVKWCGALVFTLWTTLSPFYYSAGPALFSSRPSPLLARLDIFELWSFGLLAILLRASPGSSAKKTFILTALVAVIGVGFSFALMRPKTGL